LPSISLLSSMIAVVSLLSNDIW